MSKKIPEYTNLKRSQTYIKKLKKWCSDTDNYIFGNPDNRAFPKNSKGDAVLILKTTKFFEPYIGQRWKGGGHVAQKKIKANKKLEFSVAKVLSQSNIPYYDPSESDLRLLCTDGKERYLKAVNDAGDAFVFLPHPKNKSAFENLIQFLPSFHYIDSHEKRIK